MGFFKSPGDLEWNHCRDITSAFQTSTALTTFIVVYLISSSMAVVTPPNGTQTSPSSSDENPFMMDDCKVWFSDTLHNIILYWTLNRFMAKSYTLKRMTILAPFLNAKLTILRLPTGSSATTSGV